MNKEFAHRSPHKHVIPASVAMFLAIMEHVAALTESGKVAWAIVGGIVIKVCASEDDVGAAKRCSVSEQRRRNLCGSPAVAPASLVGVPPNAVAQMFDMTQVRSPALLATTTSALEAYVTRQLVPVDRVEPALVETDGHTDRSYCCNTPEYVAVVRGRGK